MRPHLASVNPQESCANSLVLVGADFAECASATTSTQVVARVSA